MITELQARSMSLPELADRVSQEYTDPVILELAARTLKHCDASPSEEEIGDALQKAADAEEELEGIKASIRSAISILEELS